MHFHTIALVFLGAGTGGVLRHFLYLSLNPLFATLPLGTLVANVAGSGAAGALVALLALRMELEPALRPLLLVGFLGGLTTFSGFTLEVIQALETQRLLAAGSIALLHMAGSLAAAIAGIAGMRWLLA